MLSNFEEMTNEELVERQEQILAVLDDNLSDKNIQNVRDLVELEHHLTLREENKVSKCEASEWCNGCRKENHSELSNEAYNSYQLLKRAGFLMPDYPNDVPDDVIVDVCQEILNYLERY
jgi:hypothetical protein